MHVLVVKFHNWDEVELQDKLVSRLAEQKFCITRTTNLDVPGVCSIVSLMWVTRKVSSDFATRCVSLFIPNR